MTTYMTPDELRSVAKACEALLPLWEVLTTSKFGVSAEMEELNLRLYDSNGEFLGLIDWSDSGPAFYAGSLK